VNELRYIRENEFVGRFSMRDFVDSCDRAFVLYGSGEIANPPREERVEKREGLDYFRLDMPAERSGLYRMRKVIEEYSDVEQGHLARREAYIELEDLRAGKMVRLDAGHITDMRTGAAATLALRYISASAVRCTSRKEENRRDFAEFVAPQIEAPLYMAPTIADCLAGVDAVLVAVPTPRPILQEGDVREMDHLVIVAGDSRTRQVAPEILEGRQVVVDLLAQAEKSGEFLWAQQEGRRERIRLARAADGSVLTVGDAACGRVPSGRTAIYLTGMGAQDLCAAIMVYEALVAR
jgi:ornithine cyclodeaminase/alanine dehydrogenase-like protein (mu-crystallin family)